MRRNRENQLPLSGLWPDHRLAQELKAVSKILDDNPSILELVLHDLCDTVRSGQGARGSLRGAGAARGHPQELAPVVLRQVGVPPERLSELSSLRPPALALDVPPACRRTSAASKPPPGSRSTGSWSNGRRARDWNGDARFGSMPRPWKAPSRIRGIPSCCPTRFESSPGCFAGWPDITSSSFQDHRRRAKRRCLNIDNHRGKRRLRAYRDLLKVARKTAHYAEMALQQADRFTDLPSLVNTEKLRHYGHLMMRIIDQTERRVLRGEKVPAGEKVLSLFEEHTDVIKKKNRETVFGHKLFLTGGASGLMLDGEVVWGNPNDAGQFQRWIRRQYDLYGRWPRQVSCDGCFASRPNLEWAKEQGISDVAFAKKRGLKVPEMARSS